MASRVDNAVEDPFQLYDLERGRTLLRDYSGIPDHEISGHVERIKVAGSKVAPYPCIRRLRFLDLVLVNATVYPEVLDRVKHGDKFLDLACCLGQEIRQLVHDGAPSENMYGSDLHGGFFPVGYELFKDTDRLKTTFIAADIFDDDSPLVKLAGQMNIIYAGDVFHLFSLGQQEKAAERMIQLLTAKPGSLIIGRHSGGAVAGERARAGDTSGHTSFQHNTQSWRELWGRVGEATGSAWSVEADLVPEFKFASQATTGKSDESVRLLGAKGLVYTIRRL